MKILLIFLFTTLASAQSSIQSINKNADGKVIALTYQIK